MNKYESLPFEEVIRDLKFKDITWLRRKRHKKNTGSIFAENYEYIRQLLYYIFNNLTLQLVRANFYVTEKHHSQYKLFFYSKPVWFMITDLSMINLSTLNLKKFDLIRQFGIKDPKREKLVTFFL